jgi:hypothetical protein
MVLPFSHSGVISQDGCRVKFFSFRGNCVRCGPPAPRPRRRPLYPVCQPPDELPPENAKPLPLHEGFRTPVWPDVRSPRHRPAFADIPFRQQREITVDCCDAGGVAFHLQVLEMLATVGCPGIWTRATAPSGVLHAPPVVFRRPAETGEGHVPAAHAESPAVFHPLLEQLQPIGHALPFDKD